MRTSPLIPILFILAASFGSYAQAEDSDPDLKLKASYAFGLNMAERIRQTGIEFDATEISAGIRDGLMGNPPKHPVNELQAANATFLKQQQELKAQAERVIADRNKQEGEAFLAENATREGVITTDSGLQYKVIEEGTGTTPKATDTVVTHYSGKLIDGREFDSSYKRNKPATFPVKGVIKGWTEALQMMKVGAKWKLFVPSDLAYGNSKRSELITPNSTLVFDIELIDIK